MTWFHLLSSRQLAAVVVVITLAVSITGLALTARRVRETTLHQALDNGAIAGLLAALIGIYAIAAGLTAVAVWGNTGDAAANVGREAAAISVLYRDLGGYPQPLRHEARKALIDYTEFIIDDEWPRHRMGEAPSVIDQGRERLRDACCSGSSPRPKARRSCMRTRSPPTTACWRRGACACRRSQDTALPLELWVVVLLLGVIAISACFLLRVDSFAMHTTITILVAAPIALILYFIAVTDRPFQGGVSVSAEPYRAVLEKIMIPEFGSEVAGSTRTAARCPTRGRNAPTASAAADR